MVNLYNSLPIGINFRVYAKLHTVQQGSPNYSLWAKSGLWSYSI